jgi:hypothetical protein
MRHVRQAVSCLPFEFVSLLAAGGFSRTQLLRFVALAGALASMLALSPAGATV